MNAPLAAAESGSMDIFQLLQRVFAMICLSPRSAESIGARQTHDVGTTALVKQLPLALLAHQGLCVRAFVAAAVNGSGSSLALMT